MSGGKKNETVGLYPYFWFKRLNGINNGENDNKYNNANTT